MCTLSQVAGVAAGAHPSRGRTSARPITHPHGAPGHPTRGRVLLDPLAVRYGVMEAHRRLRAEQRRRPDLVCSLALSGVRGRLVSRSGEPTASQQLRECFIIASASAPVDPRRPGRRLHLDLGDIQIAVENSTSPCCAPGKRTSSWPHAPWAPPTTPSPFRGLKVQPVLNGSNGLDHFRPGRRDSELSAREPVTIRKPMEAARPGRVSAACLCLPDSGRLQVQRMVGGDRPRELHLITAWGS